MAPPVIDEDVDLEMHFRKSLKALRQGELFMDGFLEDEEFVKGSEAVPSRGADKHHIFNKFIRTVASMIVKEMGVETKKKKAQKKYADKLFEDAGKWWGILREEKASRKGATAPPPASAPESSKPAKEDSPDTKVPMCIPSKKSVEPAKEISPEPVSAADEAEKKRGDDEKAEKTPVLNDETEMQEEEALKPKKKKKKKPKNQVIDSEEIDMPREDEVDAAGEESMEIPKKIKKSKKNKVKRKNSMGSDHQPTGEELDDEGRTKPKKGKKRKADFDSIAPAKNSEEEEADLHVDNEETQKLKEKFEQEKAKILANVPKHVKSRFGMVCFADWKPRPLPALVLSPYMAPPGPGRDVWFKMYSKVKAANRLSKMTNLVYWYGAPEYPIFSLVTTNKLIKVEEGQKKGFDQLTKSQQKKVDAGQISDEIQQRMNALEEMRTDLEKEPSQRRGFIPDFEEDYDFETSEEPIEYIQDEIPIEPKNPKKPKKKSPALSRKGKGKKYNVSDKMKFSDDDFINDGDPDEEPEEEPEKEEIEHPKKKRKTKKANIVKPAKDIPKPVEKPDDSDLTIPDQSKDNKTSKVALAGPIPKPKPGDSSSVGSGDYPSEDGPDEDASIPSDSDKYDEDFHMELDPEQKKSKKTKEATKKDAKIKDAPISKSKSHSEKAGKKAMTKKAEEKKELAAFSKCEKKFGGLIDEWETSLEDKNKEAIERILMQISSHIDELTAPFIEVYGLPKLLKKTKRIVDGPSRTDVWERLKVRYTKMKALLPKKFKMPHRANKNDENVKALESKEAVQESTIPKKVSVVKDEDVEPANTKTPHESKLEKVSSEDARQTSTKPEANFIMKKEVLSPEKVAVTPKPEKKKKFSLGNLMRPGAKETKVEAKSPSEKVVSREKIQTQNASPAWILESSDEDGIELDENRELALKFLQQGVQSVPTSNGVNREAIARAIEAAIYSKSQKAPGNKDDAYWELIHNLNASIGGKDQPGTLAIMIGQGRVSSPLLLTGLVRDKLSASFNGLTVSIP